MELDTLINSRPLDDNETELTSMGTTKVVGYKKNNRPQFVEWMDKHKVSTQRLSLNMAIARAIDFSEL